MDQAIAWFLGLIAAFLGIKWQTSSRENESLRQRLSPNKEKLYADIITFLSDYLRQNKKPGDSDFKEKIIEFEKGLLLHAANTVVLAYGDFMQNFFDGKASNEIKTARSFFLMGNLIIEMRKDLGHGKYMHALQWFDPLRLWIKDVNKMIPLSKQGFRLTPNRSISSMRLRGSNTEENLQNLIEQMNSPITANDVGDIIEPTSQKIVSAEKL